MDGATQNHGFAEFSVPLDEAYDGGSQLLALGVELNSSALHLLGILSFLISSMNLHLLMHFSFRWRVWLWGWG
jgi:hypothetical protein